MVNGWAKRGLSTKADREAATRKQTVLLSNGPFDGTFVRIPFSWLECGITYNAYGLAPSFTAEYRRDWSTGPDLIEYQWVGKVST